MFANPIKDKPHSVNNQRCSRFRPHPRPQLRDRRASGGISFLFLAAFSLFESLAGGVMNNPLGVVLGFRCEGLDIVPGMSFLVSVRGFFGFEVRRHKIKL